MGPATFSSPLFTLDLERSAQLPPQQRGSEKTSLSWHHSRVYAEPRTSLEARVLRDVRFFKSAIQSEDGADDTVVLASKLVSVGYTVSIRTALGGGSGQNCFQNLHHTFLLVSLGACGGDDAHSRLVVDLHFRSCFELSDMHSNSSYAVALPPCEEFVGSEARVSQLVSFLCGEMAEAFRAAGRTCPPWRTQRSMLSKWLPARARDTVVRPAASSSGAGSPAEAPPAIAAATAGDCTRACSSTGSPSSALDMAPPLPSALHAAEATAPVVRGSTTPAVAVAKVQPLFSVQTGFNIVPGNSMLSRQLGLQVAARSDTSGSGSLQRPAALAPFDMWPQQLRGSGAASDAPVRVGDCFGAIRTVKMTGQRCR